MSDAEGIIAGVLYISPRTTPDANAKLIVNALAEHPTSDMVEAGVEAWEADQTPDPTSEFARHKAMEAAFAAMLRAETTEHADDA